MAALVLDTHALVWLLTHPERLSAGAAAAIRQASIAGHTLHVPTICLIELAYLIEKRRVAHEVWPRVRAAVTDPTGPFALEPLDIGSVDALRAIAPREVPDMPDRIIAATALALGLQLVTRDRRIAASAIETIW